MHGGISDKIKKISEIQLIDRYVESPEEPDDNDDSTAYDELLWNDPLSNEDFDYKTRFKKNEDRGDGCQLFGLQPVKDFL